ncbi:hypothetical protein [Hymenobacter baengnokdamensis]|uniref:hypothetical protein n=1 Tax=Hymenobacter baengnokdamensis TaxID=2615203 RepID=UPI0012445242|nr:hypothetical protein [Hymenobacter baengnokdamensis]
MAALVEEPRQYVQQHKDADQLQQVLDDGSLNEMLQHPHLPALLDEYRRLERLPATSLDDLRGKAERFKRAWEMGARGAGLVDLGDLASEALKPLKELLALARRLAAGAPLAKQRIDQRPAQELATLAVWPRLFPYLHFQADASCRLLLLTVHKAFHGVFDGQRTVRLGRWEAPAEGRYVFVFDEFDFLENDLLDLLAHDKEVRDPFGLVQTFYERLCRRKLTHPQYLAHRPEWKPIREMMQAIQTRIDVLLLEHKIDFPNITHFDTAEEELRGRAIFQSNRSLVQQPVYLHPATPRQHSFTLTAAPGGPNAFLLFDVVTRAVKDIIRLFNRLQAEHEDIYFEVLRQCFGSTDYLREIRQVSQIGAQYELCETSYGSLLTNGFGLYEIEMDTSQLTDPEEVGVLYHSLNDSPESMLRALAGQHLVFGLSATAHIQRVLRNFDWTGLAHPGRPTDSFGPLPNTPADEADVRHANASKAGARQNTITHEVVEPLSLLAPFGQQLAALAQADPDYFGKKAGALSHRLGRVQHVFWLLARLATQDPAQLATGPTHLVFLSSLRQVQRLLDTGGDEDGWFGATPHPAAGDKNLRIYDVWCRDETRQHRVACTVALYDARFGQELRTDPTLHAQYNALFWAGRPVVVITTYPSAGNGVNLQYYQTSADYEAGRNAGKRDFQFLHLLEAPYYYFSGVEPHATATEQHAAIKRDVYGVLKLLYAKRLTAAQASGLLGQIRRLNRYNAEYLNTTDGVLNQFSVLVQALGRIERVWQHMPEQRLCLARDVYGVLARMAADPELATECDNYLRYASGNMQTLLAAIGSEEKKARKELEDDLHDLRRANDAARDAIHRLVLELEHFKRTGEGDARQRWQWLRDDVLRHDLPRPLRPGQTLADKPRPNQLARIRGTFRSDYVREGKLLINHEMHLAPPGTNSPEFKPWDLNAAYRPVNSQLGSPLATHFRVRSYELAFVDSGTYLLPYVYQSILVGAIGEEVIDAVLKSRGIKATSAAVPDKVFEVADLKLENRPIYIDCKNYGNRTLRQFPLPPDDPFYHPNLNEAHFKGRMVSKWQQLSHATPTTAADPCRLVVMNLRHDEESALGFYDEHFARVPDWAQARIVVLTGTLKPDPADANDLLTLACERLLTHF